MTWGEAAGVAGWSNRVAKPRPLAPGVSSCSPHACPSPRVASLGMTSPQTLSRPLLYCRSFHSGWHRPAQSKHSPGKHACIHGCLQANNSISQECDDPQCLTISVAVDSHITRPSKARPASKSHVAHPTRSEVAGRHGLHRRGIHGGRIII